MRLPPIRACFCTSYPPGLVSAPVQAPFCSPLCSPSPQIAQAHHPPSRQKLISFEECSRTSRTKGYPHQCNRHCPRCPRESTENARERFCAIFRLGHAEVFENAEIACKWFSLRENANPFQLFVALFRFTIGTQFGRQVCCGSVGWPQITSGTKGSIQTADELSPAPFLSISHPKRLFLSQSLPPKERTGSLNFP
jgi:hypothetical protein